MVIQGSIVYGNSKKYPFLVLSQKYAMPIVGIVVPHYPWEATGPDLNQMMMGSEGTFGVLTEVTRKVFRWMSEKRKRFSYMFLHLNANLMSEEGS